MKDNEPVNRVTKPIAEMNNFELSRWAAMVEAVNIIQDKAEERGIPLEKISIKSLAVKKYVDSISDIICRKMNEEDERALLRSEMKGIKG